MEFEVVTLFPEIFASFLDGSLLGKARAAGTIRVHFTSPRDHAAGKYRQTDDTPYGGGVGMVMKPEPLVAAVEAAVAARGPAHRVLMTPQGAPLTQERVQALAARPRILVACGRYEGVDERVRAHFDEELALGDYVLSGGEVAAMVLIEATTRLCPGVLGKEESAVEESFSAGLLEYPQYTRPPEFRGVAVPEVLLSGNHERIRRWRRLQALLRTRDRRPDLFAALALTPEDRRLLDGEEP
jgi:tRNA (guanine37-N1)-methyltransferase